MTTKKHNNHHFLIFLALLFASIVSTTMVFVRALYSGQLLYRFLLWNLFLAWLPLILSWLGYRMQRRRLSLLFFGALWLLFFPNALYLVTDLIHLHPSLNIPLWFDAIMMFSFALTGLLLGFLSLYLMQVIVIRRTGRILGWLFALGALSLSSYGVYVGRFLRWNSWDIFNHPVTLLHDMLNSLVHPEMVFKTYTVSLLLSSIFMFSYVILFSLPQIALEPQPE